MSDHRLDDNELDALLDGSAPPGAIGSPLAAHLAQLREDAEAVTPAANAALASVLDEGLALAEAAPQGILTFSTQSAQQGILTASADKGILTRGILTASTDKGILTRGILTIRARGRALSRVLVTQFAALGLLSKAAVAGATVSVAAASAGAAGVLPPPAQVAFDDAVGRQVEQVEGDASAEDGDDDRDTGVVGGEVAEDATGADDSAPGVEGRDIAEDASDGRAGGDAGEDASEGRAGGDAAEDASQRGAEPADEATERRPDDPGAEAPSEAPSEKPSEVPTREAPGDKAPGAAEDDQGDDE